MAKEKSEKKGKKGKKILLIVGIVFAVFVVAIIAMVMLDSQIEDPQVRGNLSDDETYYAVYGNRSVESTLTEVVIPETYNGKPVKGIQSEGFKNFRNLVSITIPSCITSIGEKTFLGCNNLENVYYNGAIENWCNIVFEYEDSNPFSYASHFFVKNSNGEYEEVTEIVLPDTITKIGDYQFNGFNNVTKITIPNSVTSIGKYAFRNCSSLTAIVFEEGSKLTFIEEYAFQYCSSVTSIDLPNSVTSIGIGAFMECSSLKSITVPFVGGTLDGINATHFGYIFGASVIDYNSRFVPSSLQEVKINGGLSIGTSAFKGCSNLTSIDLPNSITNVGENAFYGCNKLKFNEYDNAYYLGNNDNEYLVLIEAKDKNIKSCNINANTKIISSAAFLNCSSLTRIEIPNSVISIGKKAFASCSNLTSIDLPNSVTSIEESTFLGCSSLTSIDLPNSVTNIGKSAFFDCSSLTSVTIPNSVTSIGESAFVSCTNLKNIYYLGTEAQWKTIQIDDKAFDDTVTVHYSK